MHNTLRAHLQMTIWLNYLESHPPDLDSTSHGFLRMKDQTYLTRDCGYMDRAGTSANTGTAKVTNLASTYAATRVFQGSACVTFGVYMDFAPLW